MVIELYMFRATHIENESHTNKLHNKFYLRT
jgi:hypothetical protein